MRFRFRSVADLNVRDKVVCPFYCRNRVTDIALQANRLLLIIKVFAIMATEAARRIDMTKVVWMCGPIDFLIVEYSAVINIFKSLDGSADLLAMSGIIISALVICLQFVERRKCINAGGVLNRQGFHCSLMEDRNPRVDLPT